MALRDLVIMAAVLSVGATFAADLSKPAPQSRKEWPTERVLVIGKRIDVRTSIVGRTFQGTEGFADGSAPSDIEAREEYIWQVYYAPDGTLEARFQRWGTDKPHSPVTVRTFTERGTWRIVDGQLCQSIPRVGAGAEVCYNLEQAGNRTAMYYSTCGALTRCYVDRLGPEGVLVPGRQFSGE